MDWYHAATDEVKDSSISLQVANALFPLILFSARSYYRFTLVVHTHSAVCVLTASSSLSLNATSWRYSMRQKLPVDTDEIDDELELRDEELKQQISEGYEAYLHGESKDLDTLIADL